MFSASRDRISCYTAITAQVILVEWQEESVQFSVKPRGPLIHHLPGSKVKAHSGASIKTTTLVSRQCNSEALEVNRPA